MESAVKREPYRSNQKSPQASHAHISTPSAESRPEVSEDDPQESHLRRRS